MATSFDHIPPEIVKHTPSYKEAAEKELQFFDQASGDVHSRQDLLDSRQHFVDHFNLAKDSKPYLRFYLFFAMLSELKLQASIRKSSYKLRQHFRFVQQSLALLFSGASIALVVVVVLGATTKGFWFFLFQEKALAEIVELTKWFIGGTAGIIIAFFFTPVVGKLAQSFKVGSKPMTEIEHPSETNHP